MVVVGLLKGGKQQMSLLSTFLLVCHNVSFTHTSFLLSYLLQLLAINQLLTKVHLVCNKVLKVCKWVIILFECKFKKNDLTLTMSPIKKINAAPYSSKYFLKFFDAVIIENINTLYIYICIYICVFLYIYIYLY